MVHEKLNIFSDKALGSIDQDKFNRTGFVKVLVRAIRESCSQHGSTVLALLGPWGCGKTSIKNLAVKELEKGPTDPRVMEFCPWQVSGTGKITTLFFEALIGQISKENEVPDAVNPDFPNLVYLLLFDRKAVERSIERSFEHRGRDFLEKIIQVSFHVPALSIEEIRREFSEQLDLFIKGTGLEHSFDPQRLSELFFSVLWQYLGNVRHIKRLFSSLSFYIAQLSSENVLEIDPVDLIGIETLRLFDTDIYEALPGHRDFLTDNDVAPSNIPKLRKINDESKEEKLDEILKLASEKAREKVARLLNFLFPSIAENYRDERESLVKRRVSRAENFYRYFTFRPGFNEVSELELHSLLLSAASPGDTEKLFQGFTDRGAFGELLVRIDHLNPELLNQEQAQGLAIALINFADRIPRRPQDLLLDDVWMSSLVFQNIVKIVISKTKGTKPVFSSAFSEIFQKSTGIIVPVQFCNAVRRESDDGETWVNKQITREEVEQLALLVVTKIKKLAHSGNFEEHLHCGSLLFFWTNWGDRNDVKSWITSTIGKKDALFWILGLVSGTAEFSDSELPKNPFRFEIDAIEKFADLDVIRGGIGMLDPTTFSARERMLAEAFSRDLNRRNEH
jgi:hypothetical protein